jgi:hypothetical protein
MRVKDVSLAKNMVTIRRALSDDVVSTPKSGADRVVPLIAELRAVLEPALRRKLPEALIVTDELGRTPSRQKVLSRFKALCRKAGTREWSFHSIRHFFVTTLLDHGVSAEAVRVLAGHSKLEITQRYAHASGRDLEGAMSRLSRGGATSGTVVMRSRFSDADWYFGRARATAEGRGSRLVRKARGDTVRWDHDGRLSVGVPSCGPATGALGIERVVRHGVAWRLHRLAPSAGRDARNPRFSGEKRGIGRGGGIRTRDDEHPKLVHYQAVRLPVEGGFLAQAGSVEIALGVEGFERNCTESTEWTEYSDDHEQAPRASAVHPRRRAPKSSCTTRLCDSPWREDS